VASGRFRRPRLPAGLEEYRGEVLHAFDYPGAEHFRGRRTLVYGNGVSGLEIAADVATAAPVVSAFRKPRYVIQKVVDRVSSDWQWYTLHGALERRLLPREELSRVLRERVLRVAGNPADFGAPLPDRDILLAGLSLCQDYLPLVRERRIVCRPGISSAHGTSVTYSDGTRDLVDVIICATGYDVDLPYLTHDVQQLLGSELNLYHRTLHPDLPRFGVVGQFLLQGPYFPLLELQARWIVGLWAGDVSPTRPEAMRLALAQPRPPVDAHHVLAATLAEQIGVAPDLRARLDLAEPLLFGPMLPPRYRLDGPGARADAADLFTEQLAASPRTSLDRADVETLFRLGLADLANHIPTYQPLADTGG
jgi:dimethylaniline monooxygenase (N-oxide forming)